MQNIEPKFTDYQAIAVGIIVKDKQILISKRHADAHQGGKWEFPGGKIEKNESDTDALKRELFEELDITPIRFHPKINIPFHYQNNNKSVKVILKVYQVEKFNGIAIGKEGQEIRWVKINELNKFNFPQANRAIITAINLPSHYYITENFQYLNAQKQLEQIHTYHCNHEVDSKLLQCRSNIDDNSLKQLTTVLNTASDNQFLIQLNSRFYQELKNISHAELSKMLQFYQNKGVQIGLHLTSHDLHDYHSLDLTLFNSYISASCHHMEDIMIANECKIDFIVISPVNETKSHPEAKAIGWEKFSQLCFAAQMPVYALGGMTSSELMTAINHGAQGIAGISFISDSNL